MHDLRWFLLAWGIFALAAALKFARLARQMRGSLGERATTPRVGSSLDNSQLKDSQKVRERLEKIWLKQ